ncbi:MAG: TrbI/VirB10 family protein (plasmid) [Nodularia sp. CChRGM 3473]
MNENIANPENQESSLIVDEILNIDELNESFVEQEDEAQDEIQDVDEAELLTKHNVITSPWSRIGIIGVPLGIGFLIFYFLFNNIINGNSQATNQSTKPTETEATEQSTSESNDGDVYAQLALARQSEQLEKIYQQKQEAPSPELPETSEVKPETVPHQSPTPPPPAPPPPAPRNYSPPPAPPPTPLPPRATLDRELTQAPDPISELNRLRKMGSFGNIAYAANENESFLASQPILTRIESEENELPITSPHQITPNPLSREGIEKIEPRWQAEKRNRQAEVNDFKIASVNFLPQEAQIINERRSRYLVVGEFASGTLITPLVKEQSRNNQQNEDGKRYVARLTEDLRDNYGNVAIARGSLMALEILRVDGANYAEAQVTSIIKDNTEYPISAGAITVQGEGGRPLIAQQFQDKGGEIARYDLTVGLFSGLGKVGEIINQPDIEDDIEDELLDGRIRRRRRVNNSRRNITGAVLEGAFGSLSEIIGRRAETSTQEILARPNVWYIPRNTKVTFLVNRTLELP